MQKVVHFEIPADDIERAKSFYAPSLTGSSKLVPMGEGEYTTVKTTAVDEQTQMPTEPGAINGGMMQRDPGISTAPVITISVDGIDDALKQIRRQRRQHRSCQNSDSGHGRIRLLQGFRGQRAGVVGEHSVNPSVSGLAEDVPPTVRRVHV
jgi:predicted enzyme related to lactoylglutathione lyase